MLNYSYWARDLCTDCYCDGAADFEEIENLRVAVAWQEAAIGRGATTAAPAFQNDVRTAGDSESSDSSTAIIIVVLVVTLALMAVAAAAYYRNGDDASSSYSMTKEQPMAINTMLNLKQQNPAQWREKTSTIVSTTCTANGAMVSAASRDSCELYAVPMELALSAPKADVGSPIYAVPYEETEFKDAVAIVSGRAVENPDYEFRARLDSSSA